MKALVSPEEIVTDLEDNDIGFRIAEVCEKEFEVAKPLFWIIVEDYIEADRYFYNNHTKTVEKTPEIDPLEEQEISDLEILPEEEEELLALLNDESDEDNDDED